MCAERTGKYLCAAHRMTQRAIEGIQAARLKEIEDQAVTFAHKAGEILLSQFRKPLAIEYKSRDRRDPVTQADREAEDWLRGAISNVFPDHGIVGEENPNSAHGSADFVWVLDPLDGTTNFLNGLPVFASSIGVLYRGRPAVGAVFVPDANGGSVVHARKGGGAFHDGRPLSVAPNAEPERGRLTGMPSYYWRMWGFKDGLRMRLGEIRSLGSIAYEMTLVARGAMQLCLFAQPKIWDVAAGVLLINEAGGRVLEKSGRRAKWSQFTEFGNEAVSLAELHGWRASILAGNTDVATHAGDRVHLRARPIFRLRRWLAERRTRKEQA